MSWLSLAAASAVVALITMPGRMRLAHGRHHDHQAALGEMMTAAMYSAPVSVVIVLLWTRRTVRGPSPLHGARRSSHR